ncbi:uncharacterized protein BO72DRAFT_528152 [Aspergillus fijiensis CBS 313.89]|uniref:Uncharacterized protein n=1 Tax=Aspergillus fijiensis CBS 313.89 TaxID=1448319 RepID=A0A8G1RP95_9EURO|nr:uncharacterized protein BO72DRAFT_528152 [Aspergillus fijiensis CBS 313.89]RAK76824.1 hypothetical protein BO72DRAFT_528152 [Aspergillus fijiensis CBS 313.89]
MSSNTPTQREPTPTKVDPDIPADPAEPSELPYHVGQEIKLHPTSPRADQVTTMHARVLDVYGVENQMACVLLIEVDPPLGKMTSPMFLKLFDRRCAGEARTQRLGRRKTDAAHWAAAVERDYHEYLCQQESHIAVDLLSQNENPRFQHLSWAPAHKEIYLEGLVQRSLANELAVWHRLRLLEGKIIPRFYGGVLATWEVSVDDAGFTKTGTCHGYLQQILHGCAFCDLCEKLPERLWGTACDDVLHIVRTIQDWGVRTDRLSLKDFDVCYITDPDEDDDESSAPFYRVFLVDLRSCVNRSSRESDYAWKQRIAWADEEGAIARDLELLTGHAWTYHRSKGSSELEHDVPHVEHKEMVEIDKTPMSPTSSDRTEVPGSP